MISSQDGTDERRPRADLRFGRAGRCSGADPSAAAWPSAEPAAAPLASAPPAFAPPAAAPLTAVPDAAAAAAWTADVEPLGAPAAVVAELTDVLAGALAAGWLGTGPTPAP
jgi:hypothetical protein